MWPTHFVLIYSVFLGIQAKEYFSKITISQGALEGTVKKTWTGKNFVSFTGIPYAQPPIGNLRFKPPLPAKPWENVLDATTYKSMCTQDNVLMNVLEVSGSEDCLYINIYTPQIRQDSGDLLPVMFFTHGGGWMSGSGDDAFCGPDFLLDEDIVLITYNYRLGFLSTGDKVVPGNNGLKDQALALKWVKDNILHFGGDPNRITIFGNSAGGASTQFQMMSPLTRDFISGAIIQSGSAFAPWALTPKEEARNKTLALAKNLGCPSTESKRVVECLRKISAVEVVQASSKLYEWATTPLIAFRPVVEGDSPNAFLPDSPENLIKSGKSAKVPVVFSFTSGEGILVVGYIFNNTKLTREFIEGFEELGPTLFIYRDYKEYSDITKKIRSFYLGNENVSLKNALQTINVFTDQLIVYPMHISTDLHLRYAKAPVYQLMYDYRGSRTFADLYADPLHNYGVCHSDELLYLFKTKLYGVYHQSELEIKAVKEITKLWTNFAKTGNPTPNSEFSQWDPVDMNNLTYYRIDNNFDGRTVKNALSDRIAFWKDIASSYVKRPLV